MAMITQTIAIVDRSNKVIGTSKQLKNVFKEAKMAYLERKAEIQADRRAKEDKELMKAVRAMSIADDISEASHRSRRHRSHRRELEREHHRSAAGGHHHPSESGRARPHAHVRSVSGSRSPVERRQTLGEFNQELYGTRRSPPRSDAPSAPPALARRSTDLPLERYHTSRPQVARSHTMSEMDQHVDMDLAYGEFHPESLAVTPRNDHQLQQQEMSSLVTKCKMLLDEANCAQHSVRSVIAHLQKNPDAMAAVALTLAEISALASKMAPGVLTAFKAGAPGVFALLAAPEFLIAVGVGVGLTVVMFGGYKIIKKIQSRTSKEEAVDEMIDINDLDRIDKWRRGITDDGVETASVATSVEGEFITPMAAASMGHLPLPRTSAEDGRKKEKKDKSRKKSDDESTMVGSETSRASRRSQSSKTDKRAKSLIKVKKPSRLRRIFE